MSAPDPTTEPPPTDSPDPERPDARLLIPATAGWLTAAVLLGRPPLVGALAAGLALLLAATLALLIHQPSRTALSRRLATHASTAWTTIGSLTVASGLALAATLHTATLHEGPVRDLAANNTTATVRLKITSDPSLRQSTTRRPPYVVVRATIEQLHNRPGGTHSTSTRVRTPVLVIGTAKWQHVRYGQHIDATGKLEPTEAGAEVAAMLSTRSPPRTVDDPPWWLRAAERVRAGLRDAVSDEPEDVRGLVPALVMGDVSGVSADLDADFRTTGLTHLSAVSGTNLTLLLAFVLPLARLIGVRARGLTGSHE